MFSIKERLGYKFNRISIESNYIRKIKPISKKIGIEDFVRN